MKISIVIPVFNEENFIEEVLKRVNNTRLSGWEKEIIVVDDGSNDKSKIKISAFAKASAGRQKAIKILYHEKNQGKGAAIKTALKEATGDYVLIQDADLEYNPNDYQKLLEPIEKNGAEIVYGSRNLRNQKRGYLLNSLGGKFLTFLVNLFFGSSLTDINTGYKVFKTEILKDFDLKSSRFEFCEEATVMALKNGYKIVEIPISYEPRKIREGKKLRPIDGLIGFWTIVRLKFFR